MRIPISKLLYFPFILSGSFLFNYPVNANMADTYKRQKACTWDTAQYANYHNSYKPGFLRYCVQPSGTIQSVDEYGDTSTKDGKLNKIVKITDAGYIILKTWKIEGNELVVYTCGGDYSSSDCIGEVKRHLMGSSIR